MDIYYKNRITGNAILISNSFYIQQGKMSELFGNWEIKIFFRKTTVQISNEYPKNETYTTWKFIRSDYIGKLIENKIEK